jgi:hypothetical protein
MLLVSLALLLFAELPLRASQYSPDLHLSLTVGLTKAIWPGTAKLPSHGNQNGSWLIS